MAKLNSDGDTIHYYHFTPIGSVVSWLKNFTNTPALPEGWIECNGQTISDSESPFDGQVAPDLNGSSGTQRFLRGSTTTGSIGGTSTTIDHKHQSTVFTPYTSSGGISFDSNKAVAQFGEGDVFSGSADEYNETGSDNEGDIRYTLTSHPYPSSISGKQIPPYYEVVFIMRIK